ncbi:cytochrome P450 [Micromonospora sp. WMMD736]|uniref:cytochrome P450 n=1 Tax=Micromonospora sp. WMMD736 TaxID=3404112 RepID=UPI003B95EBDA
MTSNHTDEKSSIGLDPLAVAAMETPYEYLNDLRERCPVSHSDAHGGFWNLFRYSDVCAAAVDAATYSSSDVTIPSEPLLAKPAPLMIDPPTHMDYRQPLLRKLTPRMVAPTEPAIRAKVTEMIDSFIEKGSADLSEDLFVPFPAFAALQLLNLPIEDFPSFRRWAQLAFTIPEPGSEDAKWELEVAMYFAPLYEQLAGSEGDDIPSIARRMQIDGREIEVMEFVMLLTTLVAAGLDTTTNASAHIALLLDERPELRQRLIDHPELIPSAVEEMLRYLTPLPMLARTVTRDVDIDGVTIPEGEKVALQFLSANHDPEQFDDPEEIDFERSPNRHVAFGMGPHRCIGMHLARIEVQVVLEELLKRIPDYKVVRDSVRRGPGVTRQIYNLPVTFTPGPRSGSD